MLKEESMLKQQFAIILVCVLLSLSACVTTTDSPFERKADPEEAAERYVQLGLEYIKRDELARARKHLTRALEIDDSNASALAAIGLIHHEEGESELAESSFLAALSSQPDYTRGRTYYGAFLFSEQRFKEALAQFQIAAKDTAYESRAQIFTNIALCNLKLGNNDGALEAYEKTLKLDRLNGRALSGATELLINKGNYKRAQHFYNRLVRLISQQGLRHSAQSLWMGIRISNHYGQSAHANSLGSLLHELYPDSEEYSLYQQMMGGA